MRTRTFIQQAVEGQSDYDIPMDWKKILSISFNGQPVEYELIIDKKKRYLRLKTKPLIPGSIYVHVVLNDVN